MELKADEIETLRKIVNGELDREVDYAAIIAANKILDRLTPAPEPEVDEATVWTGKIIGGYFDFDPAGISHDGRNFQAARQAIAELIASKDGEIEGWKATAQTASDNVFLATDRVFAAEAETTRVTKVAEKAESELAALRAENERLKEANGILEDALQEVGDDYPGSSCQQWCQQQVKSARKAAERNTAEPVATIRFDRATPGNENEMPKVISCNWQPDGEYQVYLHPLHTDGSRSGGMPPGTNAGAVEVTEGDREAAARALDTVSDSMTWEKLTAHHRTPDQLWRAKRVAQAFARHRTEAEARGRREALEITEKHAAIYEDAKGETNRGVSVAFGHCIDELKRMMTGEK